MKGCIRVLFWYTARRSKRKSLQILAHHKETGIDWWEKDVIKLYVDQSVQVLLDHEETRSVKTETGVSQGCCLLPILFNLYTEYLSNEALEGFGDFK
jgi:endoglucanase Acf2